MLKHSCVCMYKKNGKNKVRFLSIHHLSFLYLAIGFGHPSLLSSYGGGLQSFCDPLITIHGLFPNNNLAYDRLLIVLKLLFCSVEFHPDCIISVLLLSVWYFAPPCCWWYLSLMPLFQLDVGVYNANIEVFLKSSTSLWCDTISVSVLSFHEPLCSFSTHLLKFCKSFFQVSLLQMFSGHCIEMREFLKQVTFYVFPFLFSPC